MPLEDPRRLLARHGLPDADPELAPSQGDVNRTYLAGSYVVRIACPDVSDALDDWRTEILAHPYAFVQGIRTPRLVAWGEHYTILDREDGRAMSSAAPESFFRSLGALFAHLHALPLPPDPEGALDDHSGSVHLDPDRFPEPLRALAEALAPHADLPGGTFVHGDATPGNVIVGPDAQAILIDWGDAGSGHPAYDLCAIPLAGLLPALDAYGPTSADFRRRLVALRLNFAATRTAEGATEWTDELLSHRDLLTSLAEL